MNYLVGINFTTMSLARQHCWRGPAASWWWPGLAVGPLGVILHSSHLDNWSKQKRRAPPAEVAICHKDGNFWVEVLQGWSICSPRTTSFWITAVWATGGVLAPQ